MFELLKIVGPLMDPTAHGGRVEGAFDLITPLMPGYDFSDKPTRTGWDADHFARAWAGLMKRLKYAHYLAPAGDWNSAVSGATAREASAGLLAVTPALNPDP